MIYDNVKNKIQNIIVKPDDSLDIVLKAMDKAGRKLLLVVDNDKFLGLVSIGDIQRALLKNTNLKIPIKKIMRKNIKVGLSTQSLKEIKNKMLYERIEFMPILDSFGNLVDIYFWEDVITNGGKINKKTIKIPVCIIAGGKGARLKPLTNIIPKPLLPINEKPIIQEIIDRFKSFGIKKFYISINYKADIIKYYFSNINDENIIIKLIQEKKPLGTAGSLMLFKKYLKTSFIVTNCDILIDQDFYEFYQYHKKSQNDITILVSIKNYSIPYGIVKTGKHGKVITLEEKPDINYYINTGMYILEPQVLYEIPNNCSFDMTDLIKKIKSLSGKVGFYPISEGSIIDIGNWNNYLKFLL